LFIYGVDVLSNSAILKVFWWINASKYRRGGFHILPHKYRIKSDRFNYHFLF
jgi:hypothetical protein